MATSRGSRKRDWLVVLALIAGGALAACGENVEGGAACPVLCPQQNVTVLDTLFEAVTVDTSLAGFPPFGTEPSLLLASRGDTVDTRAVIRFDSLMAVFTSGGVDSSITAIDSAHLLVHVDRVHSTYSAPVTFQVYDVDTAEADTSVAAETQLFRPDRLIGTVTFDSSHIADSLLIPVDSARVMSSIIDRKRLRLGLRATSSAAVMLQIISAEGGTAPVMRYDPSPDTLVTNVVVNPNTAHPALSALAQDYRDYLLVLKAPASPSAAVQSVGGVPGRRVYMRFEVPSHILDSSTVLRATLVLTQVPSRAIDARSLFTIYPQLVTAGTEITDIARSALLVAPAGVGFDSVQVFPGDSGQVAIEVVNALRTWSLPTAKNAQRALVLRSPDEGILPKSFLFFSTEAPAGVRPRLRINYSPHANFGIP